MHLHEILNAELARASKRFGELSILETGTIRSDNRQYADDDGWSTLCFAKWVRDQPGLSRLTSIDLDISTALRVLDHEGYGDLVKHGAIELVEEHSVSFLGRWQGHADLAYLDSDNDPTLILCEYLLVKQKMPPGGIILVDDVDMRDGAIARKGHALVPWLRQRSIPYTIVQRFGTGYATGVLITEV